MGEFFSCLDGFRAVSVVGLCKNAGKTTAFNRIVEEYDRKGVTLGLTSIGRDGESSDLVTGTYKPGIFVREGTLIATAAGLLGHCDITREIVENTGISTPLGDVIIARALSDGAVQLAGPSVVAQLAQIKEIFFALGAQKALIDGAISRKTLCSRELCEAVVLCAGASCGSDMGKVVRETAHFAGLLRTKAVEDDKLRREIAQNPDARTILLGGETCVYSGHTPLVDCLRACPQVRIAYISGAVSDRLLTPVVQSGADFRGLTIAARDASKLMLSPKTLEKLGIRGINLAVLDGVELAAVTANPFSAYGLHFDAGAFLAGLRSVLNLPVIDVLSNEL